jgi:phospholipase C
MKLAREDPSGWSPLGDMLVRWNRFVVRPLIAAAFAVAAGACNGGDREVTNPVPLQVLPSLLTPAANGKIKHVVIEIQENRSFNNLFYGYPGAKTAKYGYDSAGQRIKLEPISLKTSWDIDHSSTSFVAACNGTGSIPGTHCRMNGFNKEYFYCGHACPIKYPSYAYVPYNETKPYFEMAEQYVLADRMYASNFDASSFVSHQYIIAAQAEKSVNFPDGQWGCSQGSSDTIDEVGPQRQIPHGSEQPCWNTTTLGDELDQAGIPWAYYAATYYKAWSGWNGYQVIKHIYDGPDWNKDMFTEPSRFLRDVAKGKLRTVTWITPTCANSDHAGCYSDTGPSWVASVVNAVGESKFWKSTAIFIFWDDYGGWYDPEPPAYVDYDGLGFRLPMLIISPYAKKGYVSHVHYEHGSILKFIEDQFGLGRLAASDRRATSPERDCFDFNQPPRKFKKIHAPHDAEFFLRQPADYRIPDAE